VLRERVEGALENFLGRAGGVDAQQEVALGVVRNDGDGGFGVGRKASFNGLKPIVGQVLERAAAMIADAGLLGWPQRVVEDCVAMRADAASGQALGERGARQLVGKDGVELKALECEQGVERVSLGEGARETDEEESSGAAQAGAAIAEELKDDVVGDELSAVDAVERLRGSRAGREGMIVTGAEEFAGRKRAGAEGVGEQGGLGVFSGAGRADEDEPTGTLSGRRLQAVSRVAVKPSRTVSEVGHGRNVRPRRIPGYVDLGRNCAVIAKEPKRAPGGCEAGFTAGCGRW